MPISNETVEFLTRFLVESDAIENIQDDPDIVRLQLRNNHKNGHVGALLLLKSYAENKKKILTENLLCKVQGLITAEQHLKQGGPKLEQKLIGRYRQCGVRVGNRRCPNQEFVPRLMGLWIEWVERWQNSFPSASLANLHQIAAFHFYYLEIHPFADGNGRSCRALTYYLLQYCGLRPFVFTAHDKHATYYPCFDGNEPSAMYQYFEEKTNTSL